MYRAVSSCSARSRPRIGSMYTVRHIYIVLDIASLGYVDISIRLYVRYLGTTNSLCTYTYALCTRPRTVYTRLGMQELLALEIGLP